MQPTGLTGLSPRPALVSRCLHPCHGIANLARWLSHLRSVRRHECSQTHRSDTGCRNFHKGDSTLGPLWRGVDCSQLAISTPSRNSLLAHDTARPGYLRPPGKHCYTVVNSPDKEVAPFARNRFGESVLVLWKRLLAACLLFISRSRFCCAGPTVAGAFRTTLVSKWQQMPIFHTSQVAVRAPIGS